jgi:protein-S-isoprenylcysteine O-methyltransferase Ste14
VPNAPNAPPRAPWGSARAIAGALAGALAVAAFDALLLALALGGVPALLAHPRALTLLGIWTAGGIVLALLRPVRNQAPVATEREPGYALVLLLLLPLATPPIAALGERLALFPLLPGNPPALEWAGVAAVAVGLAARIAGMARLGPRFSPLVTVQQGHVLEQRGIYAIVRHPGYAGSLLACAGAMFAFGSGLALPLVASFAGLLQARIAREERLLERHFGDEFDRYRERTGGLWPRLWGRRG